jgi:beta-galactosidase
MKRVFLLVALWAGALFAADGGRERELFNAGWKFFRGDDPDVGESLNYERVKPWMLATGDHLLNYAPARTAPGPARLGWWLKFPRVDFDDRAWRTLDLPHDWGIEGPFDQELAGSTGKLPWAGTGWYRKKFALPASDSGRRIYLEFDGAMSYALVWCNGQLAGGWAYGYSSWRVDLTPFVKAGAENVVAVRLSPPRESSRWYPGAGIYRNVWLSKSGDVAVAHWGVAVTTPQVSADAALVNVSVTLDNHASTNAEVQTTVRLFAADANGAPTGEPIAVSEPAIAAVPAGRQANYAHTLRVSAPRLWSLRERNRYVAETRVLRDGAEIDVVRTPFGIRRLTVSACRFAACACITTSARSALPSTRARSSGRSRFCSHSAATRSAPATIRPRPSYWSCATAWECS